MIRLCKSEERAVDQRRRQTVQLTFYPRDRADPRTDGFGILESLSESLLPPNAGAQSHLFQNVEVLTYVSKGAVGYRDSSGGAGVIDAGEFQRTSFGRAVRRSERNVSGKHWAHVFQIWLLPSQTGLETSHEQIRFSAAQRRGKLCLVASADRSKGSLLLHQDASVYSALLDPGQHVVHEIGPGRCGWLHLVQGEAGIGDLILSTGDGAGFTAERVMSLTARKATEVLFLDLCEVPMEPTLKLVSRDRSRAI